MCSFVCPFVADNTHHKIKQGTSTLATRVVSQPVLSDSTDSLEKEVTATSPQLVIEWPEPEEEGQKIRLPAEPADVRLLADQKSHLTAETDPSSSEAGKKGAEATPISCMLMENPYITLFTWNGSHVYQEHCWEHMLLLVSCQYAWLYCLKMTTVTGPWSLNELHGWGGLKLCYLTTKLCFLVLALTWDLLNSKPRN